MGGPNGSQGAFWLILGLKTANFEQFSKKFYIFLLFKIILYSKTLMKLKWELQKSFRPTKIVIKVVQKLQK